LRRGFLLSGGVEKPQEGLVAFLGFAAPHGGKKTGGILWVLAWRGTFSAFTKAPQFVSRY